MDLRQLACVVAVAEEGSFTRAAARCEVVQSALSAQVARLEDELSTRLFDRTSRSVRLTAAGELLLPHARSLLRGAEVARAELAAYTGVLTGRLRLGMVGGVTGPLAPVQHALVTFHELHPGVEISVQDTGSRRMVEQVLAGQLDLAFVSLYADQVPRELAHRLLFDEPLVAVVGRGHALADRAGVSLAELAAHGPFIDRPAHLGARLQADEAFRRAGIERTVAFEFSNPGTVMQFVALGLGVALVPAAAAAHAGDVVAIPLLDCAAGHPIALVHPDPAPRTPGARAFLALISDKIGIAADPLPSEDSLPYAIAVTSSRDAADASLPVRAGRR